MCRWLLSPVKFVATVTLTVTVMLPVRLTLPVRLAVTVTACRGRGPIPGLALAQRCQRMCQG